MSLIASFSSASMKQCSGGEYCKYTLPSVPSKRFFFTSSDVYGPFLPYTSGGGGEGINC